MLKFLSDRTISLRIINEKQGSTAGEIHSKWMIELTNELKIIRKRDKHYKQSHALKILNYISLYLSGICRDLISNNRIITHVRINLLNYSKFLWVPINFAV